MGLTSILTITERQVANEVSCERRESRVRGEREKDVRAIQEGFKGDTFDTILKARLVLVLGFTGNREGKGAELPLPQSQTAGLPAAGSVNGLPRHQPVVLTIHLLTFLASCCPSQPLTHACSFLKQSTPGFCGWLLSGV